MKGICRAFAGLLLLGVLSACGGAGSPGNSPPTNRAPVISSYNANPNSGSAPLAVTFNWNVSDPDNDAMTCAIDADNNGTNEYTIQNCTSLSSQQHTYQTAGNFAAKLTVTDGKGGSANNTANVSVTTPQTSWAPAPVSGLPPATLVRAAGNHTCALTSSGTAYCWGNNLSGQLGNDSTTPSSIPVVVSGGLSFSALATGGGEFRPTGGAGHTCGLTRSGAAYCWGWGNHGQLGDGSTTSSSIPVAVSGGLNFSAVATGYGHTCGLTSSGAAYCWGFNGGGFNGGGQLGDGSTTSSSIPVAVSGGLSFSALAAGGNTGISPFGLLLIAHTCGLTTSGEAYCWGSNLGGQLGDGSTTSRSIPVPVSGSLRFSAVATGGFHTCGLTTSGEAYCWGQGTSGQLGHGSAASSSIPVPVSGGLSFSGLTTGYYHTCGLTGSGAAYCWGWGNHGQLGDGSTTSSSTPVAVSGGLSFTALVAGGGHTCGLTSSGVVYCWGNNFFGQLGRGS